MAYIHEATGWQRRRRRRQQVTLAVVLLLLLGAGGVAYAYYEGALGSPDDSTRVSTLPPCPTGKPALTRGEVKVNVYNTTRRDGLASEVAADLRKRSFQIGTVANDPKNTNPKGTAVIRYGALGKDAAKLVIAQVPKASAKADKRKGASVDLVIGEAFAQLAPAPKPTITPTPKPCTTVTPKPSGTGTPKPAVKTR